MAIDGTHHPHLRSAAPWCADRGNVGQAAFVGGTNGLVNQGTIRADLTGQTLTLSTSTFSNTATGLVAVEQRRPADHQWRLEQRRADQRLQRLHSGL